MRTLSGIILAAALGVVAVGCEKRATYEGPKVDAFNGKLTADGKPVSFPAGEEVELKMFHQKGESFNIPINQDGTFKIGWMPIGKYTASLARHKANASKGAGQGGGYNIPGGVTIADGQTEYTIELGKNFKP